MGKFRQITAFLMALVMVFMLIPSYVLAGTKTTTVKFVVRYGQTEARSMLGRINELRTGDDAWYWNSSDTEKVKVSGLKELVYDYELEKVAIQRAAEISVYWDHTRPDGTDCFSAYTGHGSYSAMGENIALGYGSEEAVFVGWAEEDKSYSGQGHRRNMLSGNFNAVGIGHVVRDWVHYWVQEFGYASPVHSSETEAMDSDGTARVSIADSEISIGAAKASMAVNTLRIGETADLPVADIIFRTTETWGDKNNCTATVTDLQWTSSDPSVVSVSGDKIKGEKAGTAELSAAFADQAVSVKLTVSDEVPEPGPEPEPEPEPQPEPQLPQPEPEPIASDDDNDGIVPAVAISKAAASKKALTVKWKKISTADRSKISGIEIQYSKDKKFKKGVKTVKVGKTKTSKKITKLKSGKKYYVRIRAYRTADNGRHVSKWSKVKSAKVR